ncbi:hypothetical protein FNV43_RR16227 [Rhamnella rubrinervis]|uniref:Uncharacterized protein n=1 Tax=Rhamnella rubrinervis TaxID=2594499 RepID=A0A8K0E4Y5_9ROSA|nr:hypothetical protein FNV43_RR16227 [Rhamnella rubrinervis]
MSISGSGIAEAYVMKKLHKEKMKQMEEEKAKAGSAASTTTTTHHSGEVKESNSSGDCFLGGLIKKVHPSNGQILRKDSDDKHVS